MLELLPTTVRLRDHRSGIEYDHAALTAAVVRRQEAFTDLGLSPAAHVVLCHGEGAAFIIDLLAAWRVKAVVVAVTPTLTQAERLRVKAATNPALWIGSERQDDIAWLPPQQLRLQAASPRGINPSLPAIDTPALVLMTSGTTSRPKGVVHSHRSLYARMALNLCHIDRSDLAKSLSLLPMHFGHGLIGNCLTPLMAGAHLTLWPEPGIAGFAALSELIDNGGTTFMSSVPAMWRIVVRAAPPPRRGSLRRIHVGSAPLSLELWESIARWCGTQRIVNTYGTTETANWVGGHSLEDGPSADGLVGRPWGGAIRVVGPDGTLADTGQGQVAVATPSLMTGYLGEPDLTKQALQNGWFLTGDQGVIDAAGRLRLIGRREHEINKGGVKIPAEEVDLLLEGHPDVAEACAFPLDDPIAGEMVAAAVVPAKPSGVDAAELLNWCQTRIRKEAVPTRIFLVESLPRTERGKISRDAVRTAALGAPSGARRAQ